MIKHPYDCSITESGSNQDMQIFTRPGLNDETSLCLFHTQSGSNCDMQKFIRQDSADEKSLCLFHNSERFKL